MYVHCGNEENVEGLEDIEDCVGEKNIYSTLVEYWEIDLSGGGSLRLRSQVQRNAGKMDGSK